MSNDHPHPSYSLPKRISRINYDNLTLRAKYLRTLGTNAERIIDDFSKSDIAKRPIKGMSPHQLDQHVMKYADRLLRAEKRIIKEAHPGEWQDDDRLRCIEAAIRLQNMAATRDYAISLKPGKFVVELGSIKIETEYVGEQIVDSTKIIQLWCQSQN